MIGLGMSIWMWFLALLFGADSFIGTLRVVFYSVEQRRLVNPGEYLSHGVWWGNWYTFTVSWIIAIYAIVWIINNTIWVPVT